MALRARIRVTAQEVGYVCAWWGRRRRARAATTAQRSRPAQFGHRILPRLRALRSLSYGKCQAMRATSTEGLTG